MWPSYSSDLAVTLQKLLAVSSRTWAQRFHKVLLYLHKAQSSCLQHLILVVMLWVGPPQHCVQGWVADVHPGSDHVMASSMDHSTEEVIILWCHWEVMETRAEDLWKRVDPWEWHGLCLVGLSVFLSAWQPHNEHLCFTMLSSSSWCSTSPEPQNKGASWLWTETPKTMTQNKPLSFKLFSSDIVLQWWKTNTGLMQSVGTIPLCETEVRTISLLKENS